MPLKPDQLARQLQGGLEPVYLVAGDELLLVQECVDQIRGKAREQGFDDRVVLTVDRSFDWLELARAAESRSLFAEGKIIELRIPTGKPGREGSQAILDYLEGDDGSNVLLVTSNAMDKSIARTKWVQALDRQGVFVQIWPVKPAELPAWIRQRMQNLDLQADADAVQMLSERLEGNLLAANQEIQKLKLLKGAGRITAADISDCVADSARFDVFRLVEAAHRGQLGQALRIATGLRAASAELPMLVGALAWELGLLGQVKTLLEQGSSMAAAFREKHIWQARQQPMQAVLTRLSRQQLGECTRLLARLDRQTKGAETGDPWTTLDDLVAALAGFRSGAAA